MPAAYTIGLLTASSWLPDLPRTVPAARRQRVRAVLDEAHRCGLQVLYGLGVYSWGSDEVIAHDPQERGPNRHAMCGSRATSERWMQPVVDYLQVMDPADRRAHGRRLHRLLPALERLEPRLGARARVRRTGACIERVLRDIDTVTA